MLWSFFPPFLPTKWKWPGTAQGCVNQCQTGRLHNPFPCQLCYSNRPNLCRFLCAHSIRVYTLSITHLATIIWGTLEKCTDQVALRGETIKPFRLSATFSWARHLREERKEDIPDNIIKMSCQQKRRCSRPMQISDYVCEKVNKANTV